jgi:hypothetical protein
MAISSGGRPEKQFANFSHKGLGVTKRTSGVGSAAKEFFFPKSFFSSLLRRDERDVTGRNYRDRIEKVSALRRVVATFRVRRMSRPQRRIELVLQAMYSAENRPEPAGFA